MDADRARKRLTEERQRIEQEIADLSERTSSDDAQESDWAADLDQSEREQSIREELTGTLDAIERAERRLEDGTYGLSIASGEPIPDGRLEVVPWAERTVEEGG